MPDTTHLHTIARKRRWTHADAVCLVTAWHDTGDSLAAFARAIGCHHIRLRRWAWGSLLISPRQLATVQVGIGRSSSFPSSQ